MAREHIDIAVVIDTRGFPGREVLRGVLDHFQRQPEWRMRAFARERPLKAVRDSHPTGIIAQARNERDCAMLRSFECPVVVVSSNVEHAGLPQVASNNMSVGREAARYLYELGLRSFAYLGVPKRLFSADRGRGFAEGVDDHDLEVSELVVPRDSYGGSRMQAWLRAIPKPAGVLGCDEVAAVAVVELSADLGLRVPDDVAVIAGNDEEHVCLMAHPTVSAVKVGIGRLGETAAQILERLLRGRRGPNRPVLIPPAGIVERASTDVCAVADPVVASALRIIRKRDPVGLDVRTVVRELPVGRRTLEQRFRATLGTTVNDEIRRARLNRACDLLRSSDMPLKEIAWRTGFSSPQWFSTSVAKHTGMSPRAYRAAHRSAAQ